ncbi:MAG: UvrD-helicase domain-containing protein [Magnetococcales bacterium]|nr:UvrD-helicase domain-containing protein [Magnetococcales bacterium]
MSDPILSDLNEPQRQAVTAGAGPLMVLAGAGSGKTRVLTRRIAHLVARGAARPAEIMAVTFTNKAAREMRDRIAQLLVNDGTLATSSHLWIGTFHSIGARLLRQHAESLGYSAGFTILDSSDQKEVVKKLVDMMEFRHAYWTPERLANSISRWKDDGIHPEELGPEQIQKERDRQQVATFYQHYQSELQRTNCMDFGDLLLKPLLLWQQQPQLLEIYAERFRYLLVDEYQDTNAVQYRWIRALASIHRNLSVVGDDDQSIYSWRGARLDNILRFSEDFPDVRVIRLEQNYRSTANILTAASHLISHNSGRMKKQLWTEDGAGDRITRYTARDGQAEADFVADEIEQLVRHGQSFSDCAILVRTGRQTRLLEERLGRRMIPYQIVGGIRFMDRAEIRDALAYLRLVVSHQDDLAFERAVQTPKRGLGSVTLQQLRDQAAEQQLSLLNVSRRLVNDPGSDLRPAVRRGLGQFVELIDQSVAMVVNGANPAGLLDHLLTHSGYLASLEQEERFQEKQDNLMELRNELERRQDLTAFLEDVALVTDMIEQQKNLVTLNRVIISTLHAAKGLEFPVVFLVGLEEELLPHKLAVNDGGSAGLEEERRLTYVGITRARERLYLTHALQRWVGTRPVDVVPSRFLAEIPSEVVYSRGSGFSINRGVSNQGAKRWGQW